MNVLIYVVSMILVLAAISYARLETYRSLAILEASFSHYMKKLEGEQINQLYLDQYQLLQVKKYQSSAAKNQKAKGTSRLSLYFLFNKEEREKHPVEAQQLRMLFKQLMITLYGEQLFFKEMMEKRPQFLDQMIDALQEMAPKEGEKVTVARMGEISRLELPDRELHYLLFLMLQGLKEEEVLPEREVSVADYDDQEEARVNIQEAYAPVGYRSLYDFTTASGQFQLRVFLADPILLQAVYQDPVLVSHILERRGELYKLVAGDPSKLEEASQMFEEEFSHQGNAQAYHAILNFAVTRTKPRGYVLKKLWR